MRTKRDLLVVIYKYMTEHREKLRQRTKRSE
jgi:hypothetical protein